jgi:quinol monooxygenase YgiN
MSIVVVATLQAKPGSEAKLQSLLRGLIKKTHEEAGNHLYALHVSKRDATRFVMVEKWEDDDSLAEHMKAPHMEVFAAAAADLLASAPTIIVTDPIPAGDKVQGQV